LGATAENTEDAEEEHRVNNALGPTTKVRYNPTAFIARSFRFLV